MQLGDLVVPLQDELPSRFDQQVVSIVLIRSLEYRELQKSGRKSTSAKNKGSTSVPVSDPASMGPPQFVPKKGKGAAAVVPMSKDEDGNTQSQPTDADMDVDAEMNDAEDVDEANANESQGEDEGEEDEGEEEEDEEPVDQMAVEDEELRRETKGLDLHNPQADVDEDV